MPYPITGINALKFTDILPRPHFVNLDMRCEPYADKEEPTRIRVRMVNRSVSIHKDLDPVPSWTYEGQYPGPAIVVRRGQKVQIEWVNELVGTLPIKVVTCAASTADPPDPPQNHPGPSNGSEDAQAKALLPWNVVHLHGGRTQADSDGWTDNAFLARPHQDSSQLSLYTNDQPATLLWYHDHAMGITSYNVFSGLAGMWIIRDHEEDQLNLPSSEFEIPLLIQDRNLDTDAAQQALIGRLLHKVETDLMTSTDNRTMEFFGPFTLVNGVLWPNCPVKPCAYRLRVLNGSNARAYQLMLVDNDGTSYNHLIRQIGTDGGLLPAPIKLEDITYPVGTGNGLDGKPKGLILAPAERADLIIDFSKCAGKKLQWMNVAAAPYDGVYAQTDTAPSVPVRPGQSANGDRLPYPEVMQFEVSADTQSAYTLPTILSRSFVRWSHDSPQLSGHQHRYIALHEYKGTDPQNGQPGKMGYLYFNELEMVDGPSMPGMRAMSDMAGMGGAPDMILTLRPQPGKADQPIHLSNNPVLFYDAIHIFPNYGKPEIWNILNFTGDTHPIHLHLIQFQILSRDSLTQLVQGQWQGITPSENGLLPCGAQVKYADQTPGQVDLNEQGWKDTVRVNPGEVVSIACIFDGYNGRFMYHCHVLEHEDDTMMRPIIVIPEAVAALSMPMHTAFQCSSPT